VVERGGGARLAEETLARHLVPLRLAEHQFERDGAMEAQILGLIDLAHAAGTESFDNPIM
jgi:hypothetical protein